MTETLTLSDFTREETEGKIRTSVKIEVGHEPSSRMWFDVDPVFSEFLSHNFDAFLLCVLPLALNHGRGVAIKGAVSPQLLFNVQSGIVPVLADYYRVPRIQVSADEIRSENNTHGAVMTGFSGGVDSFCTFHDHTGNDTPEHLRITHLLLSNAGHHGARTDDALRVYRQRLATLRTFADEVGLPIIAVDSNMGEFIPGPFQKTHALRNAAVALMLQRGVQTYLYSSTYPYAATKVGPSKDIAYMDPVLLPMLGTEAVRCVPTGGQHTRVGKTRALLGVPASRQFLDVCTRTYLAPQGMPNCGICWKCMRTEATLDLLGVIDEFAGVFPLDRYRHHKKLYFVEVMGSKDTLTREIRDLVAELRTPVSLTTKALAALLPSAVASNVSRTFPKIRNAPLILQTANVVL